MNIDITKRIIEKKGENISKINKKLGLGGGGIGRWNKNEPSIDRVQRVAQYLGVTVSTLLGESDEIAEKYAQAGEKEKRLIRIILDME